MSDAAESGPLTAKGGRVYGGWWEGFLVTDTGQIRWQCDHEHPHVGDARACAGAALDDLAYRIEHDRDRQVRGTETVGAIS